MVPPSNLFTVILVLKYMYMYFSLCFTKTMNPIDHFSVAMVEKYQKVLF